MISDYIVYHISSSTIMISEQVPNKHFMKPFLYKQNENYIKNVNVRSFTCNSTMIFIHNTIRYIYALLCFDYWLLTIKTKRTEGWEHLGWTPAVQVGTQCFTLLGDIWSVMNAITTQSEPSAHVNKGHKVRVWSFNLSMHYLKITTLKMFFILHL